MQPQIGVGVINPADLGLDRELWRWVPDSVTLHMTRLVHRPGDIDLTRANELSDPQPVKEATHRVLPPEPAVVAYACSMASFIGGAAGERALVNAMLEAGAPAATTSSGAMVSEFIHHGYQRVALLTPYGPEITERLCKFLDEFEIGVTNSLYMGLRGRIWTLNYEQVADAARQIDTRGADALYIACTNVLTYDLIKPLQKELGLPVLSANQTTIAAALRLAGVEPTEHTQLPTPPAVVPLQEERAPGGTQDWDFPEKLARPESV
ncbi:maleate cis-trans isomerase family protein [Thermocrispum municipale]|jgi:maleate isomerase|uniref:maleate cis-trans isomerase family protein n=1 Tax=Thermocrispum municipale TaxID=37926 RepID=UPI0003FAF82E|nr:Asp/Glu/hydantoin racemase [Thermocrispum municipale]